MYKKSAFSLIEVLVATSILSIAVFGVYKMIGENNKIINNSNNYLNSILLFPIIETCIEKNNLVVSGLNYIDLGNDYKLCNLTTSETKNIIDNIEYVLIAEVKNNLLDKSRIWELVVKNDFSGTSTGIYIQKK